VSSRLEEKLDAVASAMQEVRSLLFVTGAGISADSGLPTYRGIGGLYEEADTPEGRPIEDVLSGETMRDEPALTWKYIHQIEAACRGATFNPAHTLIAEAEERFERVWVLTQNVDGLHRKAGSRHVIDIHGDVHEILCPQCGYRETLEDYSALAPLPLCPRCSHALRPDVVLFGELLPLAKVATMEKELERGFDMVFSIGTTSVFPYISRPVLEAARLGRPTVEINPGETFVSRVVSTKLTLGAAEACTAIWDRLGGRPVMLSDD
jgi:NAD-dependent deacetylase